MKLLAILLLFSYILLQLFGFVIGNPIFIKRNDLAKKPKKIEYYVSFDYYGGEKELVVQSDSTVNIEIEYNYNNGCFWTLVNAYEIKTSESIKKQTSTYQVTCTDSQTNDCGDLKYIYSFYVKDASKTLPSLNLICKKPNEEKNFGEIVLTLKSGKQIIDVPTEIEPSTKIETTITSVPESTSEIYEESTTTFETLEEPTTIQEEPTTDVILEPTTNVILEPTTNIATTVTTTITTRIESKTELTIEPTINPSKKEIVVSFDCEEGGKQELEVENNTYVHVKLTSNKTSGPRSWFLVNEQNITQFEGIELQDSSFEINSNGSTQHYVFYITDAMQEFPTLYFVYEGLELFNEAFVTLVHAKSFEPEPESTSEIYEESATTFETLEEPTTIQEEPTTDVVLEPTPNIEATVTTTITTGTESKTELTVN